MLISDCYPTLSNLLFREFSKVMFLEIPLRLLEHLDDAFT